jgi:Spy/CpxP family protein refolding chaperone
MTKWNIKTIVLLSVTLLMATGIDALAQRGRGFDRGRGAGQACMTIPGLTDDQRAQLSEMRTAHLREMQTFRGQIDINRAQYRALISEENASISAINANIDERTALRNQMEKKQAGHHQAIRSLLTEEQRVYFDAFPRGARMGMGQQRPGARGPAGPGVMRNSPPFYRGH